MEQIIITKPNGSTYPLASKRTATEIKSAKQSWALLADDVVSISIESPFPQTYGIGDHFTVFGRAYKLNRLPKVKKTGMHAFSYDLEFEGIQYDLIRATYDLTIDTTNNQLQDVQADTLTGNLRRFSTVLISNANRVFPNTWVLGSCPDTIEDKTLTFGEGDNCLSVLQTLCTEFGVEFEIVQSNGKFTINFVSKVGQIFPFTFEFGKGKGLYSLDRQNVDSSNIITRLKVYGSTSNITNKYRASRLCLPGKSKAQSYIEKPEAVAKYGIYESTKYFDDIKPTFNGSITGLVSGSVLKFIDTKMFDLNALEADGKTTKYLIEGCAAKVHFNTGNLSGYEFEVHAYDHATKTFTLVKQTDDRGDVFPSESSSAFQFAQGNEYKLLDIALPDIPYQNDAENKLNEQGNIYYDQNSQPKVQYGLSVTKAYLKTLVGNGTTVNIFAPGDYIPVKDSDIDVDKSVRIKSLTRNLLDEYEYTLTISDTVSTNITNRVISELVDIDKIITINNLKDPVRARANWRSSREVLNMVFDPEGDYYTDKIKPGSIETLMLSVGAKSMQFMLQNTLIEANYQGNKNSVKVTGGVLTHYTISDKILNWNLATATTALASDSTAYYIYAKCQKAGNAGSIIFSTTQITVDQDPNYYHFWVGVVNSVVDEVRAVSLTYGATTINGKFIRTGQIESSDGSCFINLDGNGFRLGDNASSLAWNNNKDRKLRLKGTLIQSPSGAENALGVFRGSYSSYSMYYSGDEVTYNGSMYRCIQNCPTAGIMPINTTYWQIVAQKGADGNLEEIVIGGRNYFKKSTSVGILYGTPTISNNNADAPNGLYLVGDSSGNSAARMYNVINSNGFWTISFDIRGTQGTNNRAFTVDICDRGGIPINLTSDNDWKHHEITIEVTNYSSNIYNFIDFEHLGWLYIYLRNIKVEKGNKATDWTPAPEDVTAEIDKSIDVQPTYVYRGNYSSSIGYTGSNQRVDVVKYNNVYYRAKRKLNGSFSNQTPADNSAYWENFGAQFESIATNLILAEGASIGDWSIQGGKIVSTLASDNKITLDARNSQITVDAPRSGGDYSQDYGQGSKVKIDAYSGIIEARSKSNNRVAYMSPTGIFANNAETMAVAASLGITRKAAIVGLGYGNVAKSDWQNENFIAGVYGTASNSGNAPAYGGFFQNLLAAGLILKTRHVDESTSTVYLSESDSLVIGYSRYQTTVYLPSDGVIGRTIFFKQWWSGYMRVYPRSGQHLYDDSSENSNLDIGEGWAAMCVFTVGYVNGVKKEAWLMSKFRW